jgi:cyclopropane fatty-acyl-phospholipid synthase-like methyltransferase
VIDNKIHILMHTIKDIEYGQVLYWNYNSANNKVQYDTSKFITVEDSESQLFKMFIRKKDEMCGLLEMAGASEITNMNMSIIYSKMNMSEKYRITSNSKFLDIGCAMGSFCRYIKAKTECTVVGIEKMQNPVDYANNSKLLINLQLSTKISMIALKNSKALLIFTP